MNTPTEIQNAIVEEFSFFEDWTQKYEYIIECGKELEDLDPQYKTEENKVRGCQSHVWLHASYRNGKLHFTAASEAMIVKGLVALLLRLYNDRTPDEILATQPDFIEAIGMKAHLSPTRSNGLASMVKHIKAYALAYKSKSLA
ncbi:SufE family protein [bacterium]|nr:SufE family protein [bacterium]